MATTTYQKPIVDYLRSFDWNLYMHLTFTHEVSERRAEDYIHKFVHLLNRWNYGSRYHKHKHTKNTMRTEVRRAIISERQENGNTHYHVLIGDITKSTESMQVKATNAWQRLVGDRVGHSAVVLAYNPSMGGIEYMCKQLSTTHHNLTLDGPFPGSYSG